MHAIMQSSWVPAVAQLMFRLGQVAPREAHPARYAQPVWQAELPPLEEDDEELDDEEEDDEVAPDEEDEEELEEDDEAAPNEEDDEAAPDEEDDEVAPDEEDEDLDPASPDEDEDIEPASPEEDELLVVTDAVPEEDDPSAPDDDDPPPVRVSPEVVPNAPPKPPPPLFTGLLEPQPTARPIARDTQTKTGLFIGEPPFAWKPYVQLLAGATSFPQKRRLMAVPPLYALTV